ncbi:MAG: thiamine phosphate synthase [Candidatus Acidiferrales bacterium]
MFPALYAILDPHLSDTTVSDLARQLAAAGVDLIQLRDKQSPSSHIFNVARELASILGSTSTRFIVNDRPDIAALIQCGGVHLGQQDLPVRDARKICGPSQWVGVSTHNLEQLRQADQTSADYIAIGPIFPTSTKKNPDPVVGLDFIRAARASTHKPLVAIGGITLEKSEDVFRAGADSVAIIRDLTAAKNPAARAREFLAIAEKSRTTRG